MRLVASKWENCESPKIVAKLCRWAIGRRIYAHTHTQSPGYLCGAPDFTNWQTELMASKGLGHTGHWSAASTRIIVCQQLATADVLAYMWRIRNVRLLLYAWLELISTGSLLLLLLLLLILLLLLQVN